MKDPGLARPEKVFLNRIALDYKRDELPNPEQIRHDTNLLVNMALKLDEQIEKMKKTRREA